MDKKTDITEHLIHFAKDQMRVLGPVHGARYVRKCIEDDRINYGDAVAKRVEIAIFGELDNDTGK